MSILKNRINSLPIIQMGHMGRMVIVAFMKGVIHGFEIGLNVDDRAF